MSEKAPGNSLNHPNNSSNGNGYALIEATTEAKGSEHMQQSVQLLLI